MSSFGVGDRFRERKGFRSTPGPGAYNVGNGNRPLYKANKNAWLLNGKRPEVDLRDSRGRGSWQPARTHRRTLSHDSAMSSWTPRSAQSTRDTHSINSPHKRAAAVCGGFHSREEGISKRKQEKKRVSEKAGEASSSGEIPATKTAEGTCNGARIAYLQKELEQLRHQRLQLSVANAQYKVLEDAVEVGEPARAFEEWQAKVTEGIGRCRDLEAKHAAESQRARELEGEVSRQGYALAAAYDEIRELKNELVAKITTIEQIHAALAKERVHHRDAQEHIQALLKHREANTFADASKASSNSPPHVCTSTHAFSAAQTPRGLPEVSSSDGETMLACTDTEALQADDPNCQLEEVCTGDVEEQLVAAQQEPQHEKLRCRIPQKMPNVPKAVERCQSGNRMNLQRHTKGSKDLEVKLSRAKTKAARLKGIAKTAHAIVTSLAEGSSPHEVEALELLLSDAVTLSGSLLLTCGGHNDVPQFLALNKLPSDSELEKTGIPGLKGMVDELRNIHDATKMNAGHDNPKQRVQYHIRLKRELEEMRRECAKMLREKLHLECYIRHLATRCKLDQDYCFGHASAHELRSGAPLCGRGSATNGGVKICKPCGIAANKNRVLAVCEIRDIQVETLQEAVTLLGGMAQM